MKKLFFAVIAMVAMVSVSNVFANGSQSAFNGAVNEDTTTTTATDTVDTQDNNTENSNTNESVAPADSSDDTAMQLFSDTTGVEPTTADSSNVA